MPYQVPAWLNVAIEQGGRGYQARLARAAGLSEDKLSKVLKGTRVLKHEEAEDLKRAIVMLSAADAATEEPRALAPPQGSGVVERVIASKPSRGREPELVFLLNNGGYLVFQLEPRILAELRTAVQELEAAL